MALHKHRRALSGRRLPFGHHGGHEEQAPGRRGAARGHAAGPARHGPLEGGEALELEGGRRLAGG